MRKPYLEAQKSQHGRSVLASLPIFYPKPLFTAMNICVAEVWGPPGQPHNAEMGRIQTYVCPVVRNALAFLAGDGARVADGAFFPHTCDSIQGLATVLPDLGGWDRPVIHFLHPKGPRRESTLVYLDAELRKLAQNLERFTGRELSPERLRWAIELHREIDTTTLRILSRRACLDIRDHELYTTLRKGEYLWPEDYLTELKGLEARLGEQPVQRGIPVMLSGIVPEPMSIFEHLNEAGAYVAADDYAAIGRRVVAYPDTLPDDPFKALIEIYFAAPPCSTRALTMAPRREYLLEMIRSRGVKGVIFHTVTFCEPELFDLPILKSNIARLGTPMLHLESELEPTLSGQTITRLEAFVEMASSDRSKA